MRHGDKTTKKFGRTPAHKNAMLKNLAASVIEHESVTTTEAKAKTVAPMVEKLISLAKRGTEGSRRNVESSLPTRKVADKVVDVLAPRYKDREGGYISKVRLEKRHGDNTRMMKLTLIKEDTKNK